MSAAADKIAEARALIEPLTGYDTGPWTEGCDCEWSLDTDGENTYTVIGSQGAPIAIVAVEEAFGLDELLDANAALIAAAPSLRDTLAALADLADALAQENAKLREALDPNQTKADYIGEFRERICFGTDEDGNEIWQYVTISWDVTKQIMAAIRARATVGDTP